jgi:hypothetical protein
MYSANNISYSESLIGCDPAIIAPFIVELFKCFDKLGLTWAVMRGWECLPEWTRYDIDILVARKDVKLAVKTVCSVGDSYGWKTYGILRQGAMSSIWMVRQDDEHGQSYLRIDIETGNSYRGIEIHESQECLNDRVLVEKNGGCQFWRMPDGYAAIAVLLKQLAVIGEVDTERRREQVTNGLGDPQFSVLLRKALKDDALSDELGSALANGDWDGVKLLGKRVQKRLFRKTPMNLLRMARYGVGLLKQMMKPYMRCLIVLVGPDGCGKTTIADAICNRFKGRPFQSLMRVHMLFGIPRMRDIIGLFYRIMGRTQPPQKIASPGTRHCGMQPPHSMLKAIGYVTYYGFGMFLGRLRLLLWRTQSGLMVADRFYQDYYYMRGYMKCPKWYVRIMEVFSPKPDLILSLERSAEDIYVQKPELDIGEIKREQAAIRKYIGCRNNAKIIDANHGVEKTIAMVVSEIESHIMARKEF